MANDPIHQFQIENLTDPVNVLGYEISFTNSALFMGATVATVAGLLWAASRNAELVPGRLQSIGEIWYKFIADMVENVLGEDGKSFFPLVFSLFSFVLIANMLGMFPYFFTVTSQIIVTVALALFVIALVIGVGLYKHGLGWFKLFVPNGVPVVILPFISLIEIISFLSRPVSLGLASVWQHACRSHRSEGVCGLCRQPVRHGHWRHYWARFLRSAWLLPSPRLNSSWHSCRPSFSPF